MSDSAEHEVYRQHRNAQEKFIYFLLAITGSAIAYALNRAENQPLSIFLIPWGVAILLWGLSFFFGIRHIAYLTSNLYANFELIKVQKGQSKEAGNTPLLIEAAVEGINKAINANNDKAVLFAKLQVNLFMIGIFFYVVWQVIEMSIVN